MNTAGRLEFFPPLICLVKLTDFQPNAGCTLNKTLRLANPLTSPQGFYSPRGSLINDHVKYYAFKKVPPISLRVNRVHYVRSYPPASFSAIYISIQLELRQSSPRPRKLNLSETHLLSIFFFFLEIIYLFHCPFSEPGSFLFLISFWLFPSEILLQSKVSTSDLWALSFPFEYSFMSLFLFVGLQGEVLEEGKSWPVLFLTSNLLLVFPSHLCYAAHSGQSLSRSPLRAYKKKRER